MDSGPDPHTYAKTHSESYPETHSFANRFGQSDPEPVANTVMDSHSLAYLASVGNVAA
jgi:hypothetical protein